MSASPALDNLDPAWRDKVQCLVSGGFEGIIGLSAIREPLLDLRSLKFARQLFLFERADISAYLLHCNKSGVGSSRGKGNSFHPLTREPLYWSDLADPLRPGHTWSGLYESIAAMTDTEASATETSVLTALLVAAAVDERYRVFRGENRLTFPEDLIGDGVSSDSSGNLAADMLVEFKTRLNADERCSFLRYIWGAREKAPFDERYEAAKKWFRELPGLQDEMEALLAKEQKEHSKHPEQVGSSAPVAQLSIFGAAKKWFAGLHPETEEVDSQDPMVQLSMLYDDLMREALGKRLGGVEHSLVDGSDPPDSPPESHDHNGRIRVEYLRLLELLKRRFGKHHGEAIAGAAVFCPHLHLLSKRVLSKADYEFVKQCVQTVLLGRGIPKELLPSADTPIRGNAYSEVHAHDIGLVACCYKGYRLYLKTPDQIKLDWSGRMRLPQDHYSSGYASRVGDWEWYEAEDLADADGEVLEQWRKDLRVFARD